MKNGSSITISHFPVVKPKIIVVPTDVPGSPSSDESPCVMPKPVQAKKLSRNVKFASADSNLPVMKAPTMKTPAKKTPVKKTPVKKTPVKKTPFKKTPVKKTTVKKTPAKRVRRSIKFASARCSSDSEDTEHLAAGTRAVLCVVNYLKKDQNYKIFFDNWFSSVSCAYTLLERGIHSTATVQIRRVKGIKFDHELKKFAKLPRGSYEELFSNDGLLCVVRSLDNKPVNLISTYLVADPVSTIDRWSKKDQARVNVQCPSIIKKYNKHMGGVDLADMLMALYRIDRRSKKYYMRIVYYLLGVSTVNAWIFYKLNIRLSQNNIGLLEFTQDLSFMRAGKIFRKVLPTTTTYNRKKTSEDVRFDDLGHRPIIRSDRQRCKQANCDQKTSIYCNKCNVNLCIIAGKTNRNCFESYHNE